MNETDKAPFRSETLRIRDAYARRDGRGVAARYGWSQPDVLLTQYLLRSAVARLLLREGLDDLSASEILDVGCGAGGWLHGLLEWGCEPARLHGVDLLPDRIEKARRLSPGIDFRVSEGWPLPFAAESMGLVSAHTVFSSILGIEARQALAQEIMRVLRPGGHVLIYDFRVGNPRNPDTTAIGLAEIRRLFPAAIIRHRAVTLAPPIQRPLSRLSPALSHLLEALCPFLRTHAVYLLRPKN